MNPRVGHYFRSILLTFGFLIIGSFAVTAVHRISDFFLEPLDFDGLLGADSPEEFVQAYMAQEPTAIWWAMLAHAAGAFLAVYLTTMFTKVGRWHEAPRRKSFYPALIVAWFYLIAVYLNTKTVPIGWEWLAVDLSLNAVASAFAFKFGGGLKLIEPDQYK